MSAVHSYPHIRRCFSVCWWSQRGHLYWTSSYSNPYSAAMLGMNSCRNNKVKQKVTLDTNTKIILAKSHLSSVHTSCKCHVNLMWIWRHNSVFADRAESWAQLNCYELFVANMWHQHSNRIPIHRKYEPGFSLRDVIKKGWEKNFTLSTKHKIMRAQKLASMKPKY